MVNISMSLLGILSALSNETSTDNLSLRTVDEVLRSVSLRHEITSLIFVGDLDELVPYINVGSGVPKVVLTAPIRNYEFSDGCGFNNQMVFLAVGRLRKNPMWNYLYDIFNNVQGFTRGIFIVPQTEKNPVNDLEDHFKWCWKHGFSQVLVLVETTSHPTGFRAYRLNPYPNISASQIEISPATTYFKFLINDMNGAKVQTPLQFDPPRVFWKQPLSNDSEIFGYAANIFTTFLKKKNGILETLPGENNSSHNMQSILKKMLKGDISFSIHPFYPRQNLHITYPIRMIRVCLMVPFLGDVDTYKNFVRPFKMEIWFLLIVMLCVLSFLYSMCEFASSRGTRRIDFGRSFATNLRLLLYQPPSLPHSSEKHFLFGLFLLFVIFLGFYFTNLYNSTMTSFFISPPIEQQLNSLEEVLDANLSIQIEELEAHTIYRSYTRLGSRINELLHLTNGSTLINDILSLKEGTAYIANEDLIQFTLSQIQHLKHPAFRMADECIGTLPIGYLLPSHSQFITALDYFIMRCDSAGLITNWINNLTYEARFSGVLRGQKDEIFMLSPISMEELQFLPMVLGSGLALALFVFALEHLWFFLKRVRCSTLPIEMMNWNQ